MNRADGLITNLGTKSPVTEAYRTLRTNLEFISPDQPLRTLLFTSSGPGEGKSTTTANVSISMAQIGKKILLIDCDLRKPVQHKIFGISNLVGITNILVDHSLCAEDVIQRSGIDNLDLITCGVMPPNPAELLGSKRMSSLIQEFLQTYDMVILDAPPTISVTDAALLALNVDGVVLVVGSGIADRKMIRRAHELLNKVKAPIVGVVLNRVKIEKNYEYYYYYYSKGESHAAKNR